MGLIRRNKKGSDTILQNSEKWELINESGQSVRSDIDFTQMEVPKIAPENLQETAEEMGPNEGEIKVATKEEESTPK